MFEILVAKWKAIGKAVKWIIVLALSLLLAEACLKVYTAIRVRSANQHEEEASKLRGERDAARAEASKYNQEAAALKEKLTRANAKVDKLQAALDKIKIPPPATPPESPAQTVMDLKSMGLTLVLKPSVMVSPSVAGITKEDASLIWTWGNEARRIPYYEAKIQKYDELVVGLNKAKALSENLAEAKTREADAWHEASDKQVREAEALRAVSNDLKAALRAERRRKYLYAAGAVIGGYAIAKTVK